MTLYDATLHGPKKTLTCTLATATWTSDGSTIPSSESTRWGRTLQASDFPVWSFPPVSVVYIGKIIVPVRNTSGSAKTISYKMYKNGTMVTSGSISLNNNQYETFINAFYNVAVGDVLESAVWTTSNTNVTVSGSLYHVLPTRLLPTSKPCIDVSYTFGIYSYPSPLTNGAANSTEYIGNSISNSISSGTSRTFNGLSFISQNDYGLLRYGFGDVSTLNSVYCTNDSTSQYSKRSYYPTTISYRELLI
jgi:hypothetical protein